MENLLQLLNGMKAHNPYLKHCFDAFLHGSCVWREEEARDDSEEQRQAV